MTLGIDDRVPDVALTWMTANGPSPAPRHAVFSGQTVAVFGVPGAFTPACTDRHLPSITENASAIRARGVDRIACLSVNDIFVLRAWARDRGVGDDVTMLADGAGAWTCAAGLDWDLSAPGLGLRSQRYAMVVEDTRITHLAIEQGASFDVSSGGAILQALGG